MKTRAMIVAFTIMMAYAIGGRTIAQGTPAKLEPQTEFVGVWRLVSVGNVRPNGEVVTGWMGPNPSGVLIYDRSGYMSAQIMHDPRTTWKVMGKSVAQDFEDASAADKAAAFDGYYAYYGRYEVSEKDHVVRHHVESSLWPPEVGITYERHFQLNGDRLTLTTAPQESKGEQRYNRLVFERIK
jgi:hypothetical protein